MDFLYVWRRFGYVQFTKAGETVNAYMPGRVVTLLAQEGETVKAGQGILVLEAMKMENEIKSETAGVLAEIFVAAGEAVEGGDPLFRVASAAGPSPARG